MWFDLLVFIIGGALAGFLAGLLGIGGGLLIVPFLAWFLPRVHIPAESLMHVAVATSLTIIIGTSLSSIIAHYRRGGIVWSVFWQLLPGIIVGAAVAAKIADLLPSSALQIIFGSFVLLLAYGMLFSFSDKKQVQRTFPGPAKLGGAGFCIAGFCNMLGMGGGSLLVPFFSRYHMPMRNAIATSALCGFPIALFGVIALIIAGANEQGMPKWTSGYVYWPAFISIVIPSVIAAPIGAKMAHQLRTETMRQIFAVFLVLVGIDMLWTALRIIL